MHWKMLVSHVINHYPAAQRDAILRNLSEENDYAESLGYVCYLDDRRGYGRCYFTNGRRRVWQNADGWAATVETQPVQHFRTCRMYHTLHQALIDDSHFAELDEFGNQVK